MTRTPHPGGMTEARWTLTLTATDVALETGVDGPEPHHAVRELLADELAGAAEDVYARAVACASRPSGPSVVDAARLRRGSPEGCLGQVVLRQGHARPQVVYGTAADGMDASQLLLALGKALTRAALMVARPAAA